MEKQVLAIFSLCESRQVIPIAALVVLFGKSQQMLTADELLVIGDLFDAADFQVLTFLDEPHKS